VTLIIALVLAPFALLTSCFALEVFVGLRRLRRTAAGGGGSRTAVIIVPAHDEAAILDGRLAALKQAVGGAFSILLVADNCSDATADIARRHRVDVIERSDHERRGKGHALDFARRHLQANPPDVVLIVDADCMMNSKSIALLVDRCAAVGSPCQATNLQAPAPDASPAVQLSTFAFFIKNVIRQRAMQRLAGRVHLLGTGMAFPWPIFERAALATGNIVEDLMLGQELAMNGHAPIFVEEATVWSDAETTGNTLSQRRRWEGGFLQNAFKTGPAAFARSLLNGDVRSLWAAINVMIPPFALLILINLALLLGGVLVGSMTHAAVWPLFVFGGTVVLAGVALALAWFAGGSRFVSFKGLAQIPFYLAWKLPIYLGFARRGAPKEWVRTGRHDP
jgi:cellulose synthase/poly-beta-1,6-N-acetylglucosamine synthase-like glycosyltransferase